MININTLVEQINTILNDKQNAFNTIKQSYSKKDQIDVYKVVNSYIEILKDISTIKADNNISMNFIKNIKNMIKMFQKDQNMQKQFQLIINDQKTQNKECFCESLLTIMFSEPSIDEIQQKYYQKDMKIANKQEEMFIKYLKQLSESQTKEKDLNAQVVKKIKQPKKFEQVSQDQCDDIDSIAAALTETQQKRKGLKTIPEEVQTPVNPVIKKRQQIKRVKKSDTDILVSPQTPTQDYNQGQQVQNFDDQNVQSGVDEQSKKYSIYEDDD